MKRLNYIIAAGLSLVAAAACNKQVSPAAEQPEVKAGRTMTLTASIGDPGTKLSLTENEDGTVLKSTWDAEEELSLVVTKRIDNDAPVQVTGVYTFSYSGEAGKRSVDFVCTEAPELDGTENLMVIYPAVKYDEEQDKYVSDFKYPDDLELVSVYSSKNSAGKKLWYWAKNVIVRGTTYQYADNDYEHIAQTTVLASVDPELDAAGNLSVKLLPQSSVLKATLTFPEEAAGTKIYGVLLHTDDAAGESYRFTPQNTGFSINDMWEANLQDGCTLMLGDFDMNDGFYGLTVPKDLTVTVYIPFLVSEYGKEFGPDGAALLELRFYKDAALAQTPAWSAKKELKTATPITAGKMYRLSAEAGPYVKP